MVSIAHLILADSAQLRSRMSDRSTPHGNNTKQDLYLKLAASELHNGGGNRKNFWVIISVLVSLTVLISGGIIAVYA
ncbi:hypothetical protein F0562_007012 [Nyssa sinensis]|uniref:Uncharacterized protein n=1 Tax=Nyssa sinensis TaxID=561372 RepID=A0A5J5A4Q5_9ASTE|nr:hypothetical protein F0562_007012 [Nyssa sinensis]